MTAQQVGTAARYLALGAPTPWGRVRSLSTYRGEGGVMFTTITVEPFGGSYTVCADTRYDEHGREVSS